MTRPPRRMLDDPNLPDQQRALLEAARAVSPVAYDLTAGADRLHITVAELGRAPAASGVTTSSAVAGAKGAAKLASLGKLAVLMLGAAAAWSTLYLTGSLQTPTLQTPTRQTPTLQTPTLQTPTLQTPTLQTPTLQTPTLQTPVPAQPRPATPARAATSEKRTERAHAMLPPAAGARRARPPGPPRLEPATTTSSPRDSAASQPVAASPAGQPALPSSPKHDASTHARTEMLAVARARKLISTQPRAALALLEQLSRTHAAGYFVEERDALTVLALSGMGERGRAAQRAAQFVRTYPASAFVERVRAATERP